MTEEAPRKSRRPAIRQRPNSAEQPRPVMSFRIRADLHKQLKDTAEADGLAFSEEIERRLIRSFEDEQRIVELEDHIDVLRQTERLLWPDESARAIGKAFAMTLTAARHASGLDWREDNAAPLIVAGAMRRLMERCSRPKLLSLGLFDSLLIDSARAAATADSIAQTLGSYIDKTMPTLPDQEPDISNWTGKIVQVTEFRDAATNEVLQSVTEKVYDASNPEDRPGLSPEYLAAIARFKPIREKVDAETFVYWVMKDGSQILRDSHLTPAGPGPQPQAPPAEPASKSTFVEPQVDAAAKASLDVGAGSPEAVTPPAAPKRRTRTKASAGK